MVEFPEVQSYLEFCKRRCKKTVNVLPSFIRRYQRATWDVPEQALRTHENGMSLDKSSRGCVAPCGVGSGEDHVEMGTKMEELDGFSESHFWSFIVSVSPRLEIPRCRGRRPPTDSVVEVAVATGAANGGGRWTVSRSRPLTPATHLIY